MAIFPSRKFRKLRRSPRASFRSPWGREVVIPFRPLSAIFIVLLLGLSGFLFLRSDIFQVKALEFELPKESEGSVSLDSEALVRQKIMEKVVARSIFFLKPQIVEEEVKSEFPTISSVQMEKKFPDSLFIKVSLRSPLAVVKDGGGERFLVDKEGLLFQKAPSKGKLPEIQLEEGFKGEVGKSVSGEGISGYLETLQITKEKGLETQEIQLSETTIKLKLSKTTVWLDAEDKISSQIDLLTKILQRYKLSGKTPKTVDLRFSRPVVRL